MRARHKSACPTTGRRSTRQGIRRIDPAPHGSAPRTTKKRTACIDPRALKILRQLDEAGFEAYLVGGCIRDLLLGKQPKDFDIATNARPEQIASIFRNCRLIGRRFRLAHIHFGRYIIEVATFRAPPEREARTDSYGSVLEDNHYGTLEDDVVRRDFTINALYYDSKNDEIRDYVGALDQPPHHPHYRRPRGALHRRPGAHAARRPLLCQTQHAA